MRKRTIEWIVIIVIILLFLILCMYIIGQQDRRLSPERHTEVSLSAAIAL